MSTLREAAQAVVDAFADPNARGNLRGHWLHISDCVAALRAALAQQGQEVSDPTDPGHDVDVLREQVRHLERRVRELHALAQQEQEPVAHFGSAYVNENGVHITTVLGPVAIPQDAKLFTHPPRREWASLTPDAVFASDEIMSANASLGLRIDQLMDLVHAVEQALKGKNQ